HNLQSIKPTPKDKQCFDTLRKKGCQIFDDENERRATLTEVLFEGKITPALARRRFIGNTSYHDDGDLRASCLGVDVIYYVQEVRCEVASAKSEPFFEAIHYWIENVRHFLDKRGSQDRENVEKLNFPAVIVLHCGPYVGIAAAVYGDNPSAELLCCIPLQVHSTNDAQLEAGERAIAALRVAIHDLHRRYSTITDTRGPRADFPFRTFYKDLNGISHQFTYEEAIDDK
ncbi:hypothetical protein L227DRAFT_475335, partial [Lentinus tigrinus ALCF2SS1-6]